MQPVRISAWQKDVTLIETFFCGMLVWQHKLETAATCIIEKKKGWGGEERESRDYSHRHRIFQYLYTTSIDNPFPD